jgi:hypothetical protein
VTIHKRTRGPRRPTAPNSKLAPISVLASEAGVPYTSLRDIVLRGEIPVCKIGRAWYLDRSDVTRWIESRKELVTA